MHFAIVHAIRRMGFCLLMGAALLIAGDSQSSEPSGARQPGATRLQDLEGKQVAPFQVGKARAFVFFFVRTDCPISNRYAPEMRRLAEKYGKQDVVFSLVYPEASTSVPEIRQHLLDYQLALPALRDPKHSFVELTGVRVTPEAVVFTREGRQAYRGRIDDRFVDFGKQRAEATEHDLETALAAVLAGRPVAKSETRAVGCYISSAP